MEGLFLWKEHPGKNMEQHHTTSQAETNFARPNPGHLSVQGAPGASSLGNCNCSQTAWPFGIPSGTTCRWKSQVLTTNVEYPTMYHPKGERNTEGYHTLTQNPQESHRIQRTPFKNLLCITLQREITQVANQTTNYNVMGDFESSKIPKESGKPFLSIPDI